MSSAGDKKSQKSKSSDKHADLELQESLKRLFETRPELAMYEPRSKRELHRAVGNRSSLLHARAHLNHFDVEVLETLVAVGPMTLNELLPAAGNPPQEALEASLRRLAYRWFVEKVGEQWHVRDSENLDLDYPVGLGRKVFDLLSTVSAAEASQHTTKLGLGRFNTRNKAIHAIEDYFSDYKRVHLLMDSAPDDAKDLLAQLAVGPPTLVVPFAAAARSLPGAKWLIDHGLLFSSHWGVVELPREAGIALRLGQIVLESHHKQPKLQTESHSEDGALVAHHALTAVALIEDICRAVNILKPVGLKSGGVGKREVKRIATFLGIAEETTYIALEIANAADLIQLDVVTRRVPNKSRRSAYPETSWELRTAERHDEWILQSLGERWVHLIRSWLSIEMHPSWSGRRNAEDKLVNALDSGGDPTQACRRSVFGNAIASLGDVRVTSNIDELADFIEWSAYILFAVHLEDVRTYVEDLVNEATILGLWIDGAITAPTKLILQGRYSDAIRLLDTLAPSVVDEITIQADGTIIIGGTPNAKMLQELQMFADINTRDAAMVMRVTDASLRRSLDSGVRAPQILETLNSYAPKGVPQALQYMIEDVDRRHGNLVVGEATSYVVSDDPGVIADVARHKSIGKHKPRVISPNVVVTSADPEVLLKALQDAGFMPVLDSETSVAKIEGTEYRTVKGGTASFEKPGIIHNVDDLDDLINTIASADESAHLAVASEHDAAYLDSIIIELFNCGITEDGDGISFSGRAVDADEIDSFIKAAINQALPIAVGLNPDHLGYREKEVQILVLEEADETNIYGVSITDLRTRVVKRQSIDWAVLVELEESEDEAPIILGDV